MPRLDVPAARDRLSAPCGFLTLVLAGLALLPGSTRAQGRPETASVALPPAAADPAVAAPGRESRHGAAAPAVTGATTPEAAKVDPAATAATTPAQRARREAQRARSNAMLSIEKAERDLRERRR